MGNQLDRIGIKEINPFKERIRFILDDGEMLTFLPNNVDENFRKRETEGSKIIKPCWWYYVNEAK